MRQGDENDSDMGHSLLLNSTCDIEENKRQRTCDIAISYKIDRGHWGPPIESPSPGEVSL